MIVKTEGGSLYLPKGHPSLQDENIKQHIGIVGLQLEEYEPKFEENMLIRKSDLNYYIYNSIKDKNPINWDGIGLYRAVRTEK